MKPTALAALAALLAVARTTMAQATGSSDPGADAGVRATTEARELVATMQHNARIAFDALETARARRRRDEVRCADEALSRADVALRRSREDATTLDDAVTARHTATALTALERIRGRATASREAGVLAKTCSPSGVVVSGDRTVVSVHVDPAIVRLVP
jgi:hypothetical protein